MSKKNQFFFNANFIGSPSFWADGTEAHLLMSSEVDLCSLRFVFRVRVFERKRHGDVHF